MINWIYFCSQYISIETSNNDHDWIFKIKKLTFYTIVDTKSLASQTVTVRFWTFLPITRSWPWTSRCCWCHVVTTWRTNWYLKGRCCWRVCWSWRMTHIRASSRWARKMSSRTVSICWNRNWHWGKPLNTLQKSKIIRFHRSYEARIYSEENLDLIQKYGTEINYRSVSIEKIPMHHILELYVYPVVLFFCSWSKRCSCPDFFPVWVDTSTSVGATKTTLIFLFV